MPRVPGIDTLPPEHRRWLQAQWRHRTGWGDNTRLSQELNQRLKQDWGIRQPADQPILGYEDRPDSFSASSLWRWAQADRRRAEAITHAAELRVALVAALPQDQPELADRAAAYLEARIVETIEELDSLDGVDPVKRLEALTKAQTANTGRRKLDTERDRQELARQKWEAEQAIRAEEKAKAAASMESAARGQGVSPEGIAALREAILGAL